MWDQVGYSSFLRCRQMNNDNFQSNTYGKCTSKPSLCPVNAMLRIAQRAHCLQLLALHPAAVYFDPRTSSCLQIMGKCITSLLWLVAQHVYKFQADGPQLKLWSPHSILVTTANLLHRARFLDPFIKNHLWWKSDSFLMCLRNTFHTADQHPQALCLDITPPILAERRPLEPHKDVLCALTT